MKRIILGLSVLLMLTQNGFAKNDAEWDKMIANAPNNVWKQIYRCNKATLNHKHTADVNICLKAIDMQKAQGVQEKDLHIDYLNVGVLYEFSKKDYIKTYEYYMKSAKLGDTDAQRNLDNLCRAHSWACK